MTSLNSDDLQIHFLELPKLRVTSENVYGASAAERWAFFLKNAEQLNRSEISLMFPDKEIDEAAGVLEGISQSPEQRFYYISRLKQKYDQYSLLQEALEEGREQGLERGLEKGIEQGIERGLAEGRQIGILTGRIQLLQELLGVSVLSTEELSSWSLDQLTGLEHTLRLQLKSTT